jgi:hypothetical protein
MSIKKEITSRFNKENFELSNCGTADDGDWNGVDEYIRDFIKDLNKSEYISTLYSCEGHVKGDGAYLFFNVDEIGWDIFWQNVMPELSSKFCFIHPEIPNALYQIDWLVNVKDNEYNAGISITSILEDFTVKETGRIITPWDTKKEIFWKIIKEVFLLHYKK